MIKSVSEYLKAYYLSNGKRIIVTTLTGKQHEICLYDDNCFYSETGLKQHKLKLDWFDGIVDFIKQNGGRVKKGGCRSKAGQGNLQKVRLVIMLQQNVMVNVTVVLPLTRFLLLLQF